MIWAARSLLNEAWRRRIRYHSRAICSQFRRRATRAVIWPCFIAAGFSLPEITSSGLRRAVALRVPRRLLVFLATAGALGRAFARLQLRVGAAWPRAPQARPGCADEGVSHEVPSTNDERVMPQSQAGREAEMLIHASFLIGHWSLVIFHFLHVG